jgi:HEAT repeat protein
VKRRRLEETLAALRHVRENPETDESHQELRRVLSAEGSHAVARAAALVGEAGIGALVPDLVAAFPRFFAGLPKSDPGCSAKTAIVEALRRLEHDEPALYRRGAAHVQMEPVFGGRVDTAVDLRGASALALAQAAVGDVLVDLANLLADAEPPVRISAARAVAAHGRAAGIPLLHLRSLAGDEEPRVVAECLLGLLRLDAGGEMPFVASFLEKDGRSAEAAAIALGESRLPESLPVLRAWMEPARRRGLGRAAVFAIATLRRDEAVDLLLAVARDDDPPAARDALAALASIAAGDALFERARAAVAGRPELNDALARAFDRGGRS